MAAHSTIKADYPFEPVDCRQCERLSTFLDTVKERHPDYHARPVAAFGDAKAELLIVGLAPGMHGANRTGRPFTGDFAGILLYQTLYKFGFASHHESISKHDDLKLQNCRITNAVKCLPPQNKPSPDEIRRCNHYLRTEMGAFKYEGGRAILALGAIAHRAVLQCLDLRLTDYPFVHGAAYPLSYLADWCSVRLYDSYHCSRYNTQTKRLTTEMFEQVFARISADLTLENQV